MVPFLILLSVVIPRPYLLIAQVDYTYPTGLEKLKISLMQGEKTLDSVSAVSGHPSAQYFRIASQSKMGSYEPAPEGIWKVRYPTKETNGIEWAGSEGDYSTYWNAGLGPTFTEIVMQEGYQTERVAIGIHLDANKASDPGTAGCIGINTLDELKRYVKWHSDYAPRTVVIDWGLDTITYPINPEPKYISAEMKYFPLWQRMPL